MVAMEREEREEWRICQVEADVGGGRPFISVIKILLRITHERFIGTLLLSKTFSSKAAQECCLHWRQDLQALYRTIHDASLRKAGGRSPQTVQCLPRCGPHLHTLAGNTHEQRRGPATWGVSHERGAREGRRT
jgi:hypothetical protein